MSTSRLFKILTFKSRIVSDLYFAIVTDHKKTRQVHHTGMYPTRYWAKHAAKEWAQSSQSKAAKSLNPAAQG